MIKINNKELAIISAKAINNPDYMFLANFYLTEQRRIQDLEKGVSRYETNRCCVSSIPILEVVFVSFFFFISKKK